MNHQAASPAEGLFKAIAQRWMLPAAAATFAISEDGATLAVARSDGALSLVPLADPEPPDERIHVSADSGRATIRLRQAPPPLAITTAVLADTAVPIVPHGPAGFLAGDADGHLHIIAADGTMTSLAARLPERATLIARSTNDIFACAVGAQLVLLARSGEAAGPPIPLQAAATALAFSPDGRRLAAGLAGGVIIFDSHGNALQTIDLTGTPLALAWHPAGIGLAAALGGQGLGMVNLATRRAAIFGDFPTPVRSLDWSAAAGTLVAAGAFRIAAWDEAALTTGDSRSSAVIAGQAGLVPVQAVAAHPALRLAAAGYVNGQVVVAPLGRAEELPVQPVGAPITALAWTAAGQLVSADSQGGLALMTFPRRLFK